MKFVATLLFALAIAGGVHALHPPVTTTTGKTTTTSTTGTGTSVHSAGDTPSAPEPAGMTLALLGAVGGAALRLVRRR